MSKRDETTAATTWLSCDLAELADDLGLAARTGPDGPVDGDDDFDVVIIGSGYGGSIALHALAGGAGDGQPLRIAMLERGREYVPGAFPSSEADLAGVTRFSTFGSGTVRGEAAGLFDLRVGADVNVVLASGLGGGSLINAGVMEPPLPTVFADKRWPRPLRDDPPSADDFAAVQALLGATSSKWLDRRQTAMERLDKLGTATVQPVHITVASAAGADGDISRCIGCGDCATGCNFKAKLSVDVTLIADARRRHAADLLRVVTGASVVGLGKRPSRGWQVEVVHTEPGMRRHQTGGYSYKLRTARVIVAAGTLGSTELLMRARAGGLALSPRLGSGFSTNGDLLSLVCDTGVPSNAIADEQVAFDERNVGPTITRMIDRRDDPAIAGVIQDLGVPGALRRLFAESATTGLVIDSLTRGDPTVHRRDADSPDPAGVDDELIARSMAVAVIADDDATGSLSFPANSAALEQGTLGVSWSALRVDARQEARQDSLAALVGEQSAGATVLPNPLWRPLGKPLEAFLGQTRGPAITVHPLGGCPMGESFAAGVVDHCGRVFDDQGGVHDGLVVLDGAIVPTALGINPGLTISTLVRRAMRTLVADWRVAPIVDPRPTTLPPRPTYAIPEPVPANQPTLLAVTEKMTATLALETPAAMKSFAAELELWFQPIAVRDLTDAKAPRVLHLDAARSRLRLHPVTPPPVDDLPIAPPPPDAPPPPPRPPALLEAAVSGTLTLMRMADSGPAGRRADALGAWLRNRGIRDIVQHAADVLARRPSKVSGGIGAMVSSTWKLASRAGAVRLLEYDLLVGNTTLSPDGVAAGLGAPADWTNRRIRAHKSLTYGAGSNPVRQLMQATIDDWPRLLRAACTPTLTVDPAHFFHTGVPLVRIDRQRNSPTALLDLASLAAYVVRVLAPLHLLTLRRPDRATRTAQRLPANLAITRPFAPLEPIDLQVGTCPDGTAIKIRLSRYKPAAVMRGNPVLLIHGYSASGTTFVHDALPGGGLVGALNKAGHDVWVLDMRTSAGMHATARIHWQFEQVGCSDIPVAVDHIVQATGTDKVDIVAHCMGTAMLSLGLLLPLDQVAHVDGADVALTEKLRRRVGKLVFSQAGPALEVRAANQARAYIFQWIRHYVRLGAYEFTPTTPGMADDLLDRLLCVVPYPERDFARENPVLDPLNRTTWVATRHRMDALYGITFDLQGIDDAVLERIDDFFGPLNIETVAQVIGFARARQVADAQGESAFTNYRFFTDFAGSPVLSLHATENGLFDFTTRDHARKFFSDAGVTGRSIALEGMGHQDSLIGRNASQVYQQIVDFL